MGVVSLFLQAALRFFDFRKRVLGAFPRDERPLRIARHKRHVFQGFEVRRKRRSRKAHEAHEEEDGGLGPHRKRSSAKKKLKSTGQ